mgnify:CR=1 FL=1
MRTANISSPLSTSITGPTTSQYQHIATYIQSDGHTAQEGLILHITF